MVDGVDLARLPSSLLRKYRQGLGVLFEESMLLPDRTVAENVAYPLEVQGAARREALLRAEELLQSVALTERGKAFPSTLHQGEQRIVALLRAIAHRPKIVLLDELTTGVDARSADVLLSLTREIHRSGTTVLLATREPSVIVKLRARVLDLERGRVVRDSRLRHASSSPLTV
jgi:cell division transport system ATP-binding protein